MRLGVSADVFERDAAGDLGLCAAANEADFVRRLLRRCVVEQQPRRAAGERLLDFRARSQVVEAGNDFRQVKEKARAAVHETEPAEDDALDLAVDELDCRPRGGAEQGEPARRLVPRGFLQAKRARRRGHLAPGLRPSPRDGGEPAERRGDMDSGWQRHPGHAGRLVRRRPA